jgi:hypoxanthine phosphoribosyltransferase
MAEPFVLLPHREIAVRTQILGQEIQRYFERRSERLRRVVIVLKGADHFAQNLLEWLNYDVKVSYTTAKSYHEAAQNRAGLVEVSELGFRSEGDNILVVEDIVDTGHTLKAVMDKIQTEVQPAILTSVSLLDKPSRREVAIHPDWRGFTIPNLFVYGHGLDLAEQYRGLPDVLAFKPE